MRKSIIITALSACLVLSACGEPENQARLDLMQQCEDYAQDSAAHPGSVKFPMLDGWSGENDKIIGVAIGFTAANSFGARDSYVAQCVQDKATGKVTRGIVKATWRQYERELKGG